MPYLLSLLTASLAAAIAELLAPKGEGGRITAHIRMVAGLFLLVALLNPLREGIRLLRDAALGDPAALRARLGQLEGELACRWEDHGMVSSLAESTVLVVGLGDIGLSYARLVKAMGARVIGVKRRGGVCPEGVDELVLTDEIDRVLPEADVVFSILPNTAETAYFYTAERFACMKNSAVFINCGRGNAVSHEVLLNALQSGQIAGAAIDVCETEPLPADSPLWQEEKLVITPHVAGNFHHSSIYKGILKIALNNLERYLAGKAPENVVDLSTGYKR